MFRLIINASLKMITKAKKPPHDIIISIRRLGTLSNQEKKISKPYRGTVVDLILIFEPS